MGVTRSDMTWILTSPGPFDPAGILKSGCIQLTVSPER